ncbi:MAG TPA: DUF5666 domain-containing protein [Terriglobia bacterium]|nr:DUF5666 domain-containing protein [Terriglobia bacterium]
MKVRAVMIAMLLAGAASVPANAAQQPGQEPNQPGRADAPTQPPDNARFGDPTDTARNLQNYVYGVVKSVEPKEIICDKTEFGDGQPFKLDKKTKFLKDGKPSDATDLKAGDKVWVKIRKEKKTGDLVALRVVAGELSVRMK